MSSPRLVCLSPAPHARARSAWFVLAAVMAAGVSCATTPPPPGVPFPAPTEAPAAGPDAGAPTADAAPPTPPGDAGPEAPAAALPPPEVPPGVVGETPAQLPWVNPARCLSPCRFAPATLVRIDEAGQVAAAGKHAVDASAQPALAALVAAASKAGHELRVNSAYRSYAEQAKLYRGMKEIGRAARPGHSEHQLGTTIDLRLPTAAAVAWLAAQAPRFGFALSYPEGKQRVTGYRPEPWHVRYVGREAATEIAARGLTLEEYFRAHPDRGESGSCSDCPAPASRAKCGRVTAAGTCRGTVLTWCYEGALAAVDCKVSEQSCGRDASGDAVCR